MSYVHSGVSTSKMAISFSLQNVRKSATITDFSPSLGDNLTAARQLRLMSFCSPELALCSSLAPSLASFPGEEALPWVVQQGGLGCGLERN